ncbi:ABC transporter substrate binding protein [Gluconobacter morbifer G707]|uniref:ABC transporter substrate binding protein n=2 Tax=Gluconobacter TaxID=441 RepID=G6XK98_9PROT|nr:ABC transporter substrate binding protein [Gluconobacter morbifer G707]
MAPFLAGLFLLLPAYGSAAPLPVVCVEAVWCDIAAQIGGKDVRTQALFSMPGLDPHDLTPSPSMARALVEGSFVIINGATYDDWARPFVAGRPDRLIVADLAEWQPGQNPHLFFDTAVVRQVAQDLAAWFGRQSGLDQEGVQSRLAAFLHQVDGVDAVLSDMRARHGGTPIAAVEPVGQPLLEKAGLHLVDQAFAYAIMNHVTPSPRDVAQLDQVLARKEVRMLVVNPAIHSPQIDRLLEQAAADGVPQVRLGEILSPGQTWQGWVGAFLQAVGQVLDGHA